MRVVPATDGSVDVFLRQSWLSNARDCMEKARASIGVPSISSDAAAIGTAVHAGAAFAIEEQDADVVAMVDVARSSWADQIAGDIKWVKYDAQSGVDEVTNLAHSWWRNLRQYVTSPVHVEQSFRCHFDTFEVGAGIARVHLEGTVDLVQAESLWDWKTSSKKYSWRDKQSDSIQASVYAAAAVALGWLQYPVHFNFGVLLRGTSESQVVHVTRDANHTEWLRNQIRPLVRLALAVGTDSPWPTNDTGALCSDLWCDNWAACKGSLLAPVPFPTRKAKQ